MAAADTSYDTQLHRVRRGVVLGLLVAVFGSSLLQPAVDLLWHGLLRSRVFGLSFFETLWTGICYFELERRYLAAVTDPESKAERFDQRPGTRLYKNGTVRYTHRGNRLPEMFRFLLPIVALCAELSLLTAFICSQSHDRDLTMIKKYHGVPLERILASGNYAPSSAKRVGDSLTSLRIRETYLVPSLHRFTLTSPLQLQRALPLAAPSLRRMSLTVIGALIIYDFLFGVVHFALHKLPLVSSWHTTHHSHTEMQPQFTNQLDIPERLLLILSANWALNLLHAHPLTRIVFVPIFLGMLIQNHAGRALPFSYDRILPEGWGMGPKKHAMHHRKGNVYYAPYFTWFDNALCRLRIA